jgi:hypothetical protein
MLVHIQREPVIHAGPPQVAVRDLEPKGMDQVEPRSRERAHSAHVSGVLGDLGLEQDNMDHDLEAAKGDRPVFRRSPN